MTSLLSKAGHPGSAVEDFAGGQAFPPKIGVLNSLTLLAFDLLQNFLRVLTKWRSNRLSINACRIVRYTARTIKTLFFLVFHINIPSCKAGTHI